MDLAGKIQALSEYQKQRVNSYDLFVVGNGFDRACKYPTNYEDFLRSFKTQQDGFVQFFMSAYTKRFFINQEWNGFENLLCQYLQFLNYLFTDEDNVKHKFTEDYCGSDGIRRWHYLDLRIEDITRLPNYVFSILCLNNPLSETLIISTDENFLLPFPGADALLSFSKIYFRVHVNCVRSCRTKEYGLKLVLNALDKALDNLEVQLQNYIDFVTKKATDGPIVLQGKSIGKLISFNYSTTAQRFFATDEEDTAYIHGKVSTGVVLGVEPSMIAGQTFKEDSDYIKFFKRFRRVYKNCNENYLKKIFEGSKGEWKVGIYGHSLDLSDKSILTPIFEKKFDRYDIYCYKEKNSYKLKLAKLIGLELFSFLQDSGRICYKVVDDEGREIN